MASSFLTFQSVSLKYGEKTVLENCSFTVEPGELIAVVGASGAGKSSIFKLLTAEVRPTTGAIRMGDYRLDSLSSGNKQLFRRQIGVIFQDFRLLQNRTVAENVAYALEVCGETERIKERVETALHAVNLTPRANAFPSELSGGEAQRTAIARALVHDPLIIIADEPTGNLDPGSTTGIAEILKTLNKDLGLTILFSTHDPALVKQLNPRILTLQDGQLIGDHPSLKTKGAKSGGNDK